MKPSRKMNLTPCIFCDIVAGRAPAEIVWADDGFIAFVVLHSIADGHVVVIPRAHVASVHELDPTVYAALFDRVRTVATIVRRAYEPREVGIAVEGLSVRHVHVHVLPVEKPGDLDPCRATAIDPAKRRQIGDRLRAAAPPA